MTPSDPEIMGGPDKPGHDELEEWALGAPPTSLLVVLAGLSPLDEEFPEIDDPIADSVNL